MKFGFKYNALVLLLLCVGSLNAQQRERTGQEDLLTAKSLNIQEYRPTISNARKLIESPIARDTTMAKPVPVYVYGAKPISLQYKPDTISPATMKSEPLEPLYRAYARGAAGNGMNYTLDGYVNTLRSRDAALGIDVHGRMFDGKLRTPTTEPIIPPAPFSKWNGSLTGKKMFKKHALDGNAGYDRERIQYYGFDDTNPYYIGLTDDRFFKQVYHQIFGNIGLKSFYTDSNKMNYNISAHYDRFMDKNAANAEHNGVLNAEASKFAGNSLINVSLMADWNAVQYMDSFGLSGSNIYEQKSSSVIAGLKPVFIHELLDHKLRLEVGANLQVYANVTTTPNIYPHVYAKYNLVKEVIIPYFGIKGGYKRNSLNSLTETNPFLWTALAPLLVTNEQYNFYGGFRGSVTKAVTYNIHGAIYSERNAPLFVNYDASAYNPGISRFGENYFTIVYDTLKVQEIGGELTYRIGESLQIVGTGVYRNYQTSREVFAWQKPSIDATISGFYFFRKNLVFNGQFHFIGQRHAKGYKTYIQNDAESVGTEFLNGTAISVTDQMLKPIIDLNIGVEYRYTERLSGFLSINNLVGQRYQMWNQYPTQRLNILGGISFSFWKE